MATAVIENRVPLSELELTPEWTALTPKQRHWVTSYIASGYDALFATGAAFDTKSSKNTQLLAYEVPENARVKAVLRIHFGMSAREAFIADLEKTIQRSRGTAKTDAMKILAQVQGWTDRRDSESEEPKPVPVSKNSERYKIGDKIVQNGRCYRITKLDPNGKVLDAEEI